MLTDKRKRAARLRLLKRELRDLTLTIGVENIQKLNRGEQLDAETEDLWAKHFDVFCKIEDLKP